MGEETSHLPPMRLMNFVSEEQLEQSKQERGERVEDGTASRDRPLFEILKENKDKRDAEFNERFKHRPPKALDEDETEFLDKLEMSRRNYEQQMAEEEAQQIRNFQAAVAALPAQSNAVHEIHHVPHVQKQKTAAVKKNPHPYNIIVKVKPHAKKAKVDPTNSEGSEAVKTPSNDTEKSSDLEKQSSGRNGDKAHDLPVHGLVSYSDESEDDD